MVIVEYAETRLVKRHRGTMPIVLTCPHDGTERPANVTPRTPGNPEGCSPFEADGDTNAADVTERVAQRILESTALSPYVVIARFRRRFIDANREPRCAFVHDEHADEAAACYGEYHDTIKGFVRELLTENAGRGFLFDLHGTGAIEADPADLYLGTADGATLSRGFRRDLLFARHGLHGLLSAVRRAPLRPDDPVYRYTVSPADAAATETAKVRGGFTVRNQSPQLNCVQIEILREIREDDTRRGLLVEDLAAAIPNFVRRHAPF